MSLALKIVWQQNDDACTEDHSLGYTREAYELAPQDLLFLILKVYALVTGHYFCQHCCTEI